MSNDATGIDLVNTEPTEREPTDINSSVMDTAVRLKLVREAFGFSQRELAKRAGVTNSSISMIEQGQVSPSVQSLSRILAAFPIRLADFFSFKLAKDNRKCLVGAGVINALTSNYQQLDTSLEYLLAGQSTAFKASAVDSCGVVLGGSLQLTLLSGNQLLNQGDSFYIPASQPFRLINLSGQDARLFRCSLFVHKG